MLIITGKFFNSDSSQIEQERDSHGKLVLLAHAPSKIVLPLPEGAEKLSK